MISESKLRQKFGRKKEYVALILVKPASYQQVSMQLVKYFTKERRMPGVYVSVNKPFSILHESFKNNGIKDELLIFIDAVTSQEDIGKNEHDHCFYLESPENLSDISIAISQAVEAIDHKEKFIFLDSLSTLLVYNDAETIIKFIHFLIGKMRAWNVNGIILSLKKRGEASLIAELGQFCDMTIEI